MESMGNSTKLWPFLTLGLFLALLAACGSPAAEKVVKVEGGSYRDIPVERLAEMLKAKDFLFVNVHIPYEGEIANTDLFIPFNEIEKHLDQLPPDRGARGVLYCRSGNMSATAARTLVKLGYTNVWNLDGGFVDWKAKGNPLLFKGR